VCMRVCMCVGALVPTHVCACACALVRLCPHMYDAGASADAGAAAGAGAGAGPGRGAGGAEGPSPLITVNSPIKLYFR